MAGSISVLRFDVVSLDEDRSDVSQVVPVIDGTSLVELVRTYEEARVYDPAGGYGGLVPSFFRFGNLNRYYLGEQEPWIGKPVAVLACDCGELGCWPFQTRISIDASTVSWHDFGQPHRPSWSYAGFGPFVFDRDSYQRAVDQMTERLAERDTA